MIRLEISSTAYLALENDLNAHTKDGAFYLWITPEWADRLLARREAESLDDAIIRVSRDLTSNTVSSEA